jgi:murein DD-endopeptidase MepM/ murein hydrolase activator NlpD
MSRTRWSALSATRWIAGRIKRVRDNALHLLTAAALLFATSAVAADRVALSWPTPNDAFARGRSIDAFLQATVSGEAESGGFGCVRSNGYQFHEGIDLKPVGRDRRGEPTDDVFAAMDGVVRYINTRAGESSYGRYIVLEHPDASPAVYTLYAHLNHPAAGLKVGDRVARGQTIGLMGHTAGGYAIPKDRAHLHFEIGLWVTRNFQAWYDARKFGSPNEHGLFNGMNLMGIDPLDFMRKHRAGQVADFQTYFSQMEPAVRVRIATSRVPDFIQRYPALLTRPMPALLGGWEVKFNWTGLPFAWTPLAPTAVAGMAQNQPLLLEVNGEIERHYHCKTLVVAKRGSWGVGKDLETVLQQLFGVR